MSAVRTTCAYCGVGCGILATPTHERSATIAGDPDHPANRGRLCSKGTYLGETIGLEGRLLHPMIGDQPSGWDEALELVARKFRSAIDEHGPDSVAFYVSGQLLTEDYYVANKLMKGFIGSGNIDTNSRLCMSSAVAAHVRAFGEDVVPACYDDLDEADLILLVGSNTAWCHPILWQRVEAARAARGTKLVVIDPRRTETAECADLHLAVRPDGDVALFNGLLDFAREAGLLDRVFLNSHVDVPAGLFDRSAEPLAATAIDCDVPEKDLAILARWFTERPRTVTLFSMGVNQSRQGTDKANAIINLHLATGRINKPGSAPFSVTGQPNAMGGREVGGLANMLAAHMDFAPTHVDRAGRFWNSACTATKPGLKAVELFDAVLDGRIKALWVMGTNPAVSMPRAARVREALDACEFLVVSEIIADTDTSRFAEVRLPAAAWGEKDGTVTNSERMISRQRAFLRSPGEVRPDWWALAEVGKRMGFGEAFGWNNAAAIFREHCALTSFENDGSRMLDLGELAAISDADYDSLAPWRWGGERPFAGGRFSTPRGRARLVAVTSASNQRLPLTLNSGRYRDQWHSMTRTGLSPRLSQHRREPLVELHPADANHAGLAEGNLARIVTAHGSSIFRVAVSDAQRRGEIFVPIHWTDRLSSSGRAGLLASGEVDPISGEPGFKITPVLELQPVPVEWTGFLLSRTPLDGAPDCLWSTRVTVAGGTLYELAGFGDASPVEALLPPGPRIEAEDRAKGSRRIAVLADGRLEAALFVTRSGTLPSRDWLIAQLGENGQSAPALLAGRAAGARPDDGAIVCACFAVGAKTILRMVTEQRLTSVGEVGNALGAGTNCGSCRPAIHKLLQQPCAAVA